MKKTAITLSCGSHRLSGWYAEPANAPRALLIGLHGGSYDSTYFDYRAMPDASFARLATELGYAVLAIDRPGYGATTGIDGANSPFDAQTALLAEAFGTAWQRYGTGPGAFLVGHSIGGMLALCFAALPERLPLIGMEASGIGVFLQPGFSAARRAVTVTAGVSELSPEMRARTMYGPSGTYEQAVQDEDLAAACGAPAPELADAFDWPERFERIGPTIRVPVRINLAEHDNLWHSTPDALDAVRRLLPNVPDLDVRALPLTGHSTHGHRVARAHYLDMFSFAERCIIRAALANDAP